MGKICDEGKRKEMRKIRKIRKMRKKRKKGGKRYIYFSHSVRYLLRGKNIILEREGGKNMIFLGKYIPLPVVGPRGLVGSPWS